MICKKNGIEVAAVFFVSTGGNRPEDEQENLVEAITIQNKNIERLNHQLRREDKIYDNLQRRRRNKRHKSDAAIIRDEKEKIIMLQKKLSVEELTLAHLQYRVTFFILILI